MNKISFIGVSGLELRWVREQAGWTRARLSQWFERSFENKRDKRSVKSLARFEGLDVVPVLVVQQYRAMIGTDTFDELLRRAKEASAVGTLEAMIKRGNQWGGPKKESAES